METFEPDYNKSEYVVEGRRAQIEVADLVIVDVLASHVNIAFKNPRTEDNGWAWLSFYQPDRQDTQLLDDLIDALTFARDKLKE